MAFPSSPSNGDTYTSAGVIFVYDSTTGAWERKPAQTAEQTDYDGEDWALPSTPSEIKSALDQLSASIDGFDPGFLGFFDPTSPPTPPADVDLDDGDWYEVRTAGTTAANWPTGESDVPSSTAMLAGDIVRWFDGTWYWVNRGGGGGGGSTTLAALTDTTISSPASGEVLKHNGAGQWLNATQSINEMTDVDSSSTAAKNFLQWDTGTSKWESVQLSDFSDLGSSFNYDLQDLADVLGGVSPQVASFISWTGTQWGITTTASVTTGNYFYFQKGGGGAVTKGIALSDFPNWDVDKGTSNGRLIVYNGSTQNWEESVAPNNGSVAYFASSTWAMSAAPSTGDYLRWSGTAWVPTSFSSVYLPLAGGTMSGAINMGGENITNANFVAGTVLTGNSLAITSTGSIASLSCTTLTSTGDITVGGTVDGRDIDADGTKLDGIEELADVTDEANVTSALDGATLTTVTPVSGDLILLQDASDSSNLKVANFSDFGGGGGGGAFDDLSDVDATEENLGCIPIWDGSQWATDTDVVRAEIDNLSPIHGNGGVGDSDVISFGSNNEEVYISFHNGLPDNWITFTPDVEGIDFSLVNQVMGASLALSGSITVDTIEESTSGNGVFIDSVQIKDGKIDGIDVAALDSKALYQDGTKGLTANMDFNSFGGTNVASINGRDPDEFVTGPGSPTVLHELATFADTGGYAIQNVVGVTAASGVLNATNLVASNFVQTLNLVATGYVSGAEKYPVAHKTTTYSATETDRVITVESSITVNLPAVASSTGVVLTIKKTDATGTNTIDGNAAERIEGAATYTLTTENQYVTIVCNGTEWLIIGAG